jgi:hypothetical protein
MPFDPEQPYSYSRTKKNLLGKVKTKQISEEKYNKLSARYTKRGGSSVKPEGYMTPAQVRRAETANYKATAKGRVKINPLSKTATTTETAQVVKNKRGTKTLTKQDMAISNRNKEIYNAAREQDENRRMMEMKQQDKKRRMMEMQRRRPRTKF